MLSILNHFYLFIKLYFEHVFPSKNTLGTLGVMPEPIFTFLKNETLPGPGMCAPEKIPVLRA